MENPEVLRIEKIVEEAEGIKTFVFKKSLNAKPGQFVMLWLPRIDEKPISVSFQNTREFWLTISKRGEFTEKVHGLKKGGLLGIRGPYGNGFELKGRKIVCVAGGYGSAPLSFLAEEAIKKGIQVDFITGARTKNSLVFIERLKKLGANLLIATDDGSAGTKGTTIDLLKSQDLSKVNCVYSCGPEIMMKKVAVVCEEKGIDYQLSLERFMKCGFGICGQCCLDPAGWRVCKDGPVFNSKQVKQINEFANYTRSASGKKEKIE